MIYRAPQPTRKQLIYGSLLIAAIVIVAAIVLFGNF